MIRKYLLYLILTFINLVIVNKNKKIYILENIQNIQNFRTAQETYDGQVVLKVQSRILKIRNIEIKKFKIQKTPVSTTLQKKTQQLKNSIFKH